ncbi:DUF2062 domain-containing protein, partial [Candidatus Woesearchaeota archaeon]|nr:DUF2062 domain-containing protein [Candidatus Woesearchaeota archaeon]
MTRAVKGYRKLKRLFKKHKFKEIFVIIAKSNKTPRQIAMGAAIGIFLSIIPTFGFGMLAALVIAWFWNFNIVATYLGSLIVNPLNASFVYYINYKIGSAIIG